jgi:hypothetical protein
MLVVSDRQTVSVERSEGLSKVGTRGGVAVREPSEGESRGA